MSIKYDENNKVECNKCNSDNVDNVKFSDKRNEGFGILYECKECNNRFKQFR